MFIYLATSYIYIIHDIVYTKYLYVENAIRLYLIFVSDLAAFLDAFHVFT